MFLSILSMLYILMLMRAVNIYRFFDVPSTVEKDFTWIIEFFLRATWWSFVTIPMLQMRVLRYKVVKNLSQILTILKAGFWARFALTSNQYFHLLNILRFSKMAKPACNDSRECNIKFSEMFYIMLVTWNHLWWECLNDRNP